MAVKYIKTFRLASDGGGVATHIESNTDYTICGLDTAGDDTIHAKQPEPLDGKRRVTCAHCLELIAIVREHLKGSTP